MTSKRDKTICSWSMEETKSGLTRYVAKMDHHGLEKPRAIRDAVKSVASDKAKKQMKAWDEQVEDTMAEYEARYELPTTDGLIFGCGKLVETLFEVFPQLANKTGSTC